MSLNTPFVYAQPESLSIPSQLMGDELKSFKGAKNVIKSIPSTSGSNVGPSSTILFQIPTGGNGFIKPNSMFLRAKLFVTVTGGAGVAWKFAGNCSADNFGNSAAFDVGGASSLINRVNVNLGGTVMTYQNYNHFRNAVLPHSLNSQYFQTDLRELEYAGVTKNAATDIDVNKTIYVSIPLWVPLFNSQQAFPSLLMNSPITIEFLTETINNAFAGVTNGITNYSLSELNLVYEEIQVSPEFKSALVSSKSGQMYNIHVNDFWSIGPTNVDQSMRYQIGCGLSSLKSVLFTEQLQADVASALAEKKYGSNGLLNYTIYVNNEIVSPPNITDDSYCFAEMNRALQKINDSNCCSFLEPINNTVASGGLRNAYTSHNFLAGSSTMTLSDWGYSSCGMPASTVTIELNHGTPLSTQWQNNTAYAAASLYAFLLHDSVVSVDVSNGVVSIRK
jgi:hypothetical protein